MYRIEHLRFNLILDFFIDMIAPMQVRVKRVES